MNDRTWRYRDPRPLARVVIIFLWMHLVAAAANFFAVGAEIGALDSGEPGPLALAMMTRLAHLLVYVVTGILFLMWIYRVTANARTFHPQMNAKPGWAVGWYFVPIAFLWKPFEYFKETWKVSHDPAHPNSEETPALLNWWWGLWLVGLVASNISGRLGMREDATTEVYTTSNLLEMISDASSVALVFVVVRMLRVLSERQATTHELGSAHVFA